MGQLQEWTPAVSSSEPEEWKPPSSVITPSTTPEAKHPTWVPPKFSLSKDKYVESLPSNVQNYSSPQVEESYKDKLRMKEYQQQEAEDKAANTAKLPLFDRIKSKLSDYGEELSANPLLQSAAHPQTTGDILSLLLPSELPNISKMFTKGDVNAIGGANIYPKPRIRSQPLNRAFDNPADLLSPADLDYARNTRRTVLGEQSPSEYGSSVADTVLGRKPLSEFGDLPLNSEVPTQTPSNLSIPGPDTPVANTVPLRENLPSDTRMGELQNKFGGTQPENGLDTLGAREPVPGNTIPPKEPLDQATSKFEPNNSILENSTAPVGPQEPAPETYSINLPTKDEILDSQFRRAMLNKETSDIPRNTERTFTFDTPGKFTSEAGATTISSDITNSKFAEELRKSIDEHGYVSTIGNTMKSAMSTGDMSAPLRQGAALIHKAEFRAALPEMVKMFNSQSVFDAAMESIEKHPVFKFAKDMGLELSGLGKEERFLNAQILESIPVYGKMVKASDRAYSGFLNKLRFDSFVSMLKDATEAGLMPGRDKALAREIATFINEATGRGGLGPMGEKAAEGLNAVFYSPRLLSSRLRLMNRVLNPYMYYKQSAFVRQEALKSALALTSFNLAMNGLSGLAGAAITYKATNSDFAKNRFGNTRVDFGAGHLQPIVFLSRLIEGKYTSSVTRKTSKLGSGYGQTSYGDLIWRFLTSKEAPIMGLAGELWTGKDYEGQDKNRAKAAVERFTPMVLGDLYDILKDDPKRAALIIPGLFGASTQTYGKPPRGLRQPSKPTISMPR